MSINSFNETQPHPLSHVLSMVSLMLKQHSWVAATETVRSTKSKVFTIWLCRKTSLATDLGPCYQKSYWSADPGTTVEMQKSWVIHMNSKVWGASAQKAIDKTFFLEK